MSIIFEYYKQLKGIETTNVNCKHDTGYLLCYY